MFGVILRRRRTDSTRTGTRVGRSIAVVGLFSASLLALPSGTAASAVTPAPLVCYTDVVGVLPSGRIVERDFRNATIQAERKSAAPMPFAIDSMYFVASGNTTNGHVDHFIEHAAHQPARAVDLTTTNGSSVVGVKVIKAFRPSITARLEASSGRFYTYGVAPTGALTRWTRYIDNAGNLWFGNPKVVANGMGSLKTLNFEVTSTSGVTRDLLYGTTRSGALIQFQIPWSTPAKPRITTLKSTGFASYTGLSLSWCYRTRATVASIILVDSTHNLARFYTLTAQFSPNGANLTRRPLADPGANWHLHAVS